MAKRIPKPTPIVTRDSLSAMLSQSNPRKVEAVIGRALLALHQRQTSEEQLVLKTVEHNERGFGATDASLGSRCAVYYLKHGKLVPWMVANWLKTNRQGYPRLVKYVRQLDSIARYKKASITVTKVDKHALE